MSTNDLIKFIEFMLFFLYYKILFNISFINKKKRPFITNLKAMIYKLEIYLKI